MSQCGKIMDDEWAVNLYRNKKRKWFWNRANLERIEQLDIRNSCIGKELSLLKHQLNFYKKCNEMHLKDYDYIILDSDESDYKIKFNKVEDAGYLQICSCYATDDGWLLLLAKEKVVNEN